MVYLSVDGMKEMAEQLRRGARMLNQACPECGVPIFQDISGNIYCPYCKRPVKYVNATLPEQQIVVGSLEVTLKTKLKLLQDLLEIEKDPSRIKELIETILKILEALDVAQRIE